MHRLYRRLHRRPCRRYNTLVAEETGLALQLAPMLVGFFTYKGAVLARQSLALFAELAGSAQGGQRGGDGADGEVGEQEAGMGVASVDRAFRKKMLNEM